MSPNRCQTRHRHANTTVLALFTGQYRLTFMCPDSPIPETLFEDTEQVAQEGLWSAVGAVALLLFAAFLGLSLMALGFRRWRQRERQADPELASELLE